MGFFMFVDGLAELESAEQWDTAIKLLHGQWSADTYSLPKAIRLATECWYVLAHWDHIDNRQLDYDETKRLLIEVTDLTRSQHNSVADFLWVFGYMMSLFPQFFINHDDDFLVREQNGRNMLSQAHALQPENPIIKILYLRSMNRVDTDEYENTFIDAYEFLSSYLPGSSASEAYFREILG